MFNDFYFYFYLPLWFRVRPISCYLGSARPPEWPRRALGDLRAGHTALPALLTEKMAGYMSVLFIVRKKDDINLLRYLTQSSPFIVEFLMKKNILSFVKTQAPTPIAWLNLKVEKCLLIPPNWNLFLNQYSQVFRYTKESECWYTYFSH